MSLPSTFRKCRAHGSMSVISAQAEVTGAGRDFRVWTLTGYDADGWPCRAGVAKLSPESTMRSARVPCFKNGFLFISCETRNRPAGGARPKQGVAGGLRKGSHGQAGLTRR